MSRGDESKIRRMCGRYAAKVKSGEALPMAWRELHALLAGYNIAPSQGVFAVFSSAGEPEPRRAKWGLLSRWRPEPIINARAETVATKPSFRDAFLHRRCILPADGWYEWQKRPAPRPRTHPLARHPLINRLSPRRRVVHHGRLGE